MYYTLAASLPFPPLGENAHARWIMRWLGKNPPVAKYTQPAFEILSRARSCILQCINPDRAARFKTFAEVRAAFAKIHYRRIMQGEVVYELTELLGKGGFGKVYLARHTGTGAVVAIKYLYSNGQDARFKREQKILKEYPHRYLTRYLDFIEEPVRGDECKLYLVMEYLEGMPGASLRDRIKQSDGGLDPVEAMHLFVGYLDALEPLHQHEIIHRDIKPGNLYALAGKPEQARIFDLGIAHDQLGTVTNGRVPGTLDYMPPEFAMLESGRGSPQSDIYSLGVTFYQALTGELPFPRLPGNANDGYAAFLRRSEHSLLVNYDFPAFKTHPALADITSRALAHNPRNRPASAAAMRDEIRQVMVGLRETLPCQITQGGAAYELTSLIGESGRSRLFRGRDTASERPVAVRSRHYPGQDTKYKSAVQILMQNPHPQVVQYLDCIEVPFWAKESQLYVVLELWPDMPEAALDERIRLSGSGLDPLETPSFLSVIWRDWSTCTSWASFTAPSNPRSFTPPRTGPTLVAWLNTLPEVSAVLVAEFASKPIREQNLSEWRKYGYRQWLEQRQCLALAQEMTSTPNKPMTDQMAGWATAHYLHAIRKLMQAGGEPDLPTLRAFLHDVVSVRRGDHSAIRLQLVSERLADKRRETSEGL